MSDTDRVVYPDEVDDIKASAAAPENGDSNSVEEGPADAEQTPQVQLRNMIVAPANCPEGYKLDANGVCRQVFD